MTATDDSARVSDLTTMPQVAGMQVVVRDETPFLPKVAFVLITLASMAGAVFTGTNAGLSGLGLFARWFELWGLGLAGGFAVWRVFYMRAYAPDASQGAVDALNETALRLANRVGRILALLVLAGTSGLFLTGYLSADPMLLWVMVAGQLLLAAALAVGIKSRDAAVAAVALTFALLVAWAFADAGSDMTSFLVRALHLSAFSLWLGGAVWNIWVAMPAGRDHPNFDAVIAGASQLDRFRWVVRFALPTIIITGLIMASAYRLLPFQWWLHFPGILLPSKVLAIVVLVVVFITCPLFRHCSPVQGVCNVEDLEDENGFGRD